MTTVRTRIAPSPTGVPHVGTAYIALFNLCFAKAHGGQFILRIEDTDQIRSNHQSEQMILSALNWLGLSWDEGPDIGGPYAPYRQSERSTIYREHAKQLVDSGHAFYCFCSEARLNTLRQGQIEQKQTPRYDGHCLHLTSQNIAAQFSANTPHVIRMKVPEEGICRISDMLRGSVEIPWSQVDMQVLLKADGLPTYHLANVVDDHLMQITHVIRGEEWISSAPKHQLLYQYFGWDMPVLCHMPLLRNPDKSKLSKRKNPTSITYYRDAGYLPPALLNYLGRMGWSMPDEREQFSLGDMISEFDISRVSLGGPIFDIEKLTWLNAQWLRALRPDQLVDQLITWTGSRGKLEQIAALIAPRIATLGEAHGWLAPFFIDKPVITAQDFTHKMLSDTQIKELLQLTLWQLENLKEWNSEAIHSVFTQLSEALNMKLRDMMPSFFIAIAGSNRSTPVMETMAIIGADLTFSRLRHAIEILGELSKKELAALEDRYHLLNISI